MRYWDTSVLLKLYVEEDDSDIFHAIIEQPNEVIQTSEISRQELLRGFWGKRFDGTIKPGVERVLMGQFETEVRNGNIALVPYRSELWRLFEVVLETCYNRNRPVRVRTLDALHLASALSLKATEIVSTDARMKEAANILGLALYPPLVKR